MKLKAHKLKDSNTTLVKVKCFLKKLIRLLQSNSNTTLVKVKSNKGEYRKGDR